MDLSAPTISLRCGGRDVLVAIDRAASATGSDLARALGLPAGALWVDGVRVAADEPLPVLTDGAEISLRPPAAAAGGVAVGVALGPDAGRVLTVPRRGFSTGRALHCDVVLDDPAAPRERRVALAGSGDRWTVGASALRLVEPVPFARSAPPVIVRHARTAASDLPTVPALPSAEAAASLPQLEVIALALPVAAAICMAVLFDPRFALMGLMSPLYMVANYLGQRRRGRKARASRLTRRRAQLDSLRDALESARAAAEHERRAQHPDWCELTTRIASGASLWPRRLDDGDFLHTALGEGDDAWAPVFSAHTRDPDPAAVALAADFDALRAVPIAVDLTVNAGVAGDPVAARALARALVVRAAVEQGPADLRIAVLTTPDRAVGWRFARWLPHSRDGRHVLVAATGDEVRELCERLVAAPNGGKHTLVVVDDASLVTTRTQPARQLLNALDRRSALVVAEDGAPVPALCEQLLTVDAAMVVDRGARQGNVHRGVHGAGLTAVTAEGLARRLARFRDPEDDTASALPSTVAALALLDLRDPTPARVAARWAERRDDPSLVIPIGVTADGLLCIDLVHDGPHALIAGTTGAGKSELLRTIVASLAACASPDRVNFVLVDYKGGSAFDAAAALPHTVGLVTDLDGALTARALICLEAELKRREEALRRFGFDNIGDYQRPGAGHHPRPPLPRLLVVVDEFAALAHELPDFVDALIDIGQRGRSLGVHIILATQRPAGVVKDSLRANTNLRIALRVIDAADSRDVIGDPAAAHLDRRLPGRAWGRLGPRELVAFQAASISDHNSPEAEAPIRVVDDGVRPPAPGAARDLDRLVTAVRGAFAEGSYAMPFRPWPDPLPAVIGFDELERTEDGSIPYGIADAPEAQCWRPVAWDPARGALAVVGMVGSGVTNALASIGLRATADRSPDSRHLYAIDGGAGGLAPLAALPHCGAHIAFDEDERIGRLLDLLDAETARRKRGAAIAAPDILVLIDNAPLLWRDGPERRERLVRLLGEGPAVGIHVALGADRPAALGATIDSLCAERVLLRLSERADYGHPAARALDVASLAPGRGLSLPSGALVQVARADLDDARFERWRNVTPLTPPAKIGVLPTLVEAASLARVECDSGRRVLALGVSERTLGPAVLTLRDGDHALVAGPSRSGKSNALELIAEAVEGTAALHIVASGRSPLTSRATVAAGGIGALVDALIGSHDPAFLLVDDADLLDETSEFERLIAARLPHVHIVAAARADRLRTMFRHWTAELRRSRIAVLLRPDDGDGELAGVRLPRRTDWSPGRAFIVDESGVEFAQLARASAADAGRAA